MPSRPPPATALSVGAPSTSTLLSPWTDLASIDAARARALERRKVRHGPSVAELTEGQYASDTRVHYVPAEWTERLARSRANRRQGSEDEGEELADSEPSTGSRCGFSWDAAAVQCGGECQVGYKGVGFCNRNGICYGDLPLCDHKYPAGRCFASNPGAGAVSDAWCVTASESLSGNFLADAGFYKLCFCEELIVGPDSPIEPHDPPTNATDLPERSEELVGEVQVAERTLPGLPECTWEPGPGCSNVTQYECLEGSKAGQCSGDNWFYRPDECSSSCVHTVLLYPAPYFAVWRPGPRARAWPEGAQVPHYAPKKEAAQAGVSAFDNPEQILMSTWCKSSQIEFVGVSFFSPKYEPKARRLLDSCHNLGVCCKATQLPADFLGPEAPEGSTEFRFRMIALKPSFLLDQLEKTQQAVVYLDVDLEFHKVCTYPHFLQILRPSAKAHSLRLQPESPHSFPSFLCTTRGPTARETWRSSTSGPTRPT